MDLEKIVKFIRDQRQEKGLTQQQLADAFGITAKAVSKWERGQNAPDISLLASLSKVLDVSINEILNGCKDTSNKDIVNCITIDANKNLMRFKKNIISIVKLFIIIATTILLIFLGNYYIKNYNKCEIYKIYTQSTEVKSIGYLLKLDKQLALVLEELAYIGKDNSKIKDYSIMIKLDDKILIKKSEKNLSNNVKVKDIFEKTIISEIEYVPKYIGYSFEKAVPSLEFEYITIKGQKISKRVLYKTEAYYSN